MKFWSSSKSVAPPPEDPAKIREFKAKVDALDWAGGHAIESLTHLFAAIDALAQAEVDYYFRRRGNTKIWSIGFRSAGAVFGAAGLLLPLLASTKQLSEFSLLPWGYVSLSIAASAFAANELFNVTASHIRFVSTQLALEQIMTTRRIEWYQFLATPQTKVAQGFELLQHYASDLYRGTTSETADWAHAVSLASDKFRDSISKAQGAQRPTATRQPANSKKVRKPAPI